MAAAIGPGQHPQRHGRERRAEGGEAGLRDIDTRRRGEPRQRRHVAGLALVGRHAERRIAFEMLDRAIALLPRQIDVGGGDVVLEVDEAVLGIG